MSKNTMMDIVIRRYGFEHEITISFFRLCETASYDECLATFDWIIES